MDSKKVSSDQVSIGILTGGAGTRFGGRDKGLIEFEGEPLISWTLKAVQHQGAELIISANRNIESYAALGVPVIRDSAAGNHQGPFAGMISLLAIARHPWLMCVPCDAIRLPADLAAQFLRAAACNSADIVVLADEGGIHPTICLIRSALAADARSAFDSGERAPRRWFARHRLASLRGPSPININTPEALAALKLAL